MPSASNQFPERLNPAPAPGIAEINWTWFAERTRGSVCEVSSIDTNRDQRLGDLFSEVHRVETPKGMMNRFSPGELDAVLVHQLPGKTSDPSPLQLFRECRRVLRPGGYVMFCANYSWWYRRLLGRLRFRDRPRMEAEKSLPSCDIRTAKKWLNGAGFGTVRCYVGGGTSTKLVVVVPASRSSMLGIDRIYGRSRGLRVVRKALTWMGLGPFFYRTLLVFGYK